MYSQQEALNVLQTSQPATAEEQQALEFIQSFVNRNVRYWSRSTLEGHLTGSAWITNQSHTKAVLLHHKKLDIWVQPGGHIDDGDKSLLAAASREAREETGIQVLMPESESIFDVDVHQIPERKHEPAHWHLDIRFWFIAEEETLQLSEESNDLAWLSAEEIVRLTDEESVLRMVRKTLKG
ncbi:MAG: NUDIX hydrolase [Reinekea sp.]|jgi:8-oxo-dGTP pyrophosphatase MutT (NUDIX family)